MKNRNIRYTLSVLALLAGVGLVSCSDWTEEEGLTVNQPNIEVQNPELYAKYLESIRGYKLSNHKFIYAWFDNSEKIPFNRAQHLTVVPDSVDVVVLMFPDKLVDRELQEMEQIRSGKGSKVVFTLSYDDIKLVYDKKSKAKPAASKFLKDGAADPFLTYLNDTVKYALSLVDKYKYDGVIASFKGKSSDLMTADQKTAYTTYEAAFIGAVNAWSQSNKGKLLVFEGMPQYLTDKSILTSCKHIIIPCKDADNSGLLSYRIQMAKVDGVPTDKFVISTQTKSLDVQDTKTGFWSDGDTRSVTAVAAWAAAETGAGIAGIGIYNVNNDYYNSAFIYRYTREAIRILNPSIKK